MLGSAGAAGYWLYGDRLPSKVSQAASATAARVADAASDAARRADETGNRDSPRSRVTSRDSGARDNGARDSAREDTRASARAPVAALSWVTVTPNREAQQQLLATLGKRAGPAYVSLDARGFADAFGAALRAPLPKSANNVQLAFDGRQLLLRADIDIAVIAGDGTLSQLLGTVLQGRDTVQLGGTLDAIRVGFAQYHIESMRIKRIDVPPRIIPMVLKTLRRNYANDGVADDAIGVLLPTSIADLRLSNSRLTLYKAVPGK